MIKINVFLIAASTLLLLGTGCSSSSVGGSEDEENSASAESSAASLVSSDSKGIGKFKTVALTHPLDESMITQGKSIYDIKCQSCHKLTDENLVGPGWLGVTNRRTPEWIMNFVTNPDEMIDNDETAQQMLEVCLVRMPNQNLSDQEARGILEFMRNNDGKK